MLMTLKVFSIAITGTAPIILVWALGRRRRLLPAVAVVGLLAYVTLHAEKEWS